MTPIEALNDGYTNVGYVHGIPVYITAVDQLPVQIVAQKEWMEYLLTAAEKIVDLFHWLTRTNRAGVYILVGPTIQEYFPDDFT